MEYGRLRLILSLLCCFVFASLAAATKKPPPKPININTANSEELQQVPGIGPATAEKILQMRKSYGAFKSVDDLLSIRGIGKKRLEKMRKYLTVAKSAPKPTSLSRQKPGQENAHTVPRNPESSPVEQPESEEPPSCAFLRFSIAAG
jgi:competence ComEA-like helix-hairpin-helix protein